MNALPKICPQCKAEYRNIQAPHKPAGVIMMTVCDCELISTPAGNVTGVTVTELVSPAELELRKRKETAKAKMLVAIPYMRHAIAKAAKDGRAYVGILSVNPEGGGRVVAQFDAPEFFDELALLLDAPPQTYEDDLDAEAVALLDEFGLRET